MEADYCIHSLGNNAYAFSKKVWPVDTLFGYLSLIYIWGLNKQDVFGHWPCTKNNIAAAKLFLSYHWHVSVVKVSCGLVIYIVNIIIPLPPPWLKLCHWATGAQGVILTHEEQYMRHWRRLMSKARTITPTVWWFCDASSNQWWRKLFKRMLQFLQVPRKDKQLKHAC